MKVFVVLRECPFTGDTVVDAVFATLEAAKDYLCSLRGLKSWMCSEDGEYVRTSGNDMPTASSDPLGDDATVLQLAALLDTCGLHVGDAAQSAAANELRRQHAAIAELRAEVERLRIQVRNLKEAAATDGLHPSHKVAWADAIDVLRKRNDRLAAVIEKALKALGDIQKLPPEHGMAQNFARKTARELRLMLKEQQGQ